ncbi:MAG TPA: response regulator [Anaerolineales bacterium]|nr:response regulator [Anaerolineales bacterium]
MAKILVAEDEQDIRNLIAFTLQFAKHEPVIARDGAEALELARNGSFDLIFLDIRMPKITGYDVCRALKTESSTADTPIVFVSAKGQELEIEEGYQAGADHYILKPFEPMQVLQCVSDLLGKLNPAGEPENNLKSTPPSEEDSIAQVFDHERPDNERADDQ